MNDTVNKASAKKAVREIKNLRTNGVARINEHNRCCRCCRYHSCGR